MTKRTYKWPGQLTKQEREKIDRDAKRAGFDNPANYLRHLTGLPKIQFGPPRGNKNAVKDRE